MARKTRARSKTSRRSEGTAKRKPKQTSPEREAQEKSSVGQDERLIGAERFPRKGDEEEE
jgi:hypothetical protein